MIWALMGSMAPISLGSGSGMDVPFLSSSAINREHYNLVQSVEEASTPQQVDNILVHKVDIVRRRFEKTQLTSSECIPSLILLLYCWTATSLGQVTRAMLEFALPHAITLAEAGSTLKAKRIGYQFCTEVMDKSDELQLMLVNTLRKDLESPNPARICLALDVLLTNCPTEAIPAVTPRLIDLLAHDSSHVKRKAMGIVRNICQHESSILTSVHEKVRLRLEDKDIYVAAAALRLLEGLSRAQIMKPREAMDLVSTEFLSLQSPNPRIQRPRLRLVEVIGKLICHFLVIDPTLETIMDTVDALLRMVECATHADQVFVLECFRTISRIPTSILKRQFALNGSKALSLLGQLINSHKPNTQYLALTCLLELDPVLWAGTADDIPLVFDEGQVHTVMGFLDSSDSTIRVKTLQVLNRVDRNILLMHLTQLISAFPASIPLGENRLAERALEVSAVYDQNGEAYVKRLCEVCIQVNHPTGNKGKQKATDSGVRLVSENIVEQALLHLRRCSDGFRREFIDAAACIPVSAAGPTLTLVIAATVCEYGPLSVIPQKDLLQDLAVRLEAAPPAIQEALLLAMLRVTARCESVSTEVTDRVRRLHEISRSHIRRRCDQFFTYSGRMSSLRKVVEHAKSNTLPDFLLALETAELHQDSPLTRNRSSQVSAGSEKLHSPSTHGKLRYEPYEAPQPAPRLTRRGSSVASVDSHAASSHSSHSDSRSPHLRSRKLNRIVLGTTSSDSEDGLSRTLTAGDLALAAHEHSFSKSDLINTSTEPPATHMQHSTRSDPAEDLISKTDLIALDSPFLAEPSQPIVTVAGQSDPVDFEVLWDALKGQHSARGWSQRSTEELEKRVQALAAYTVTSLSPATLENGNAQLALSSPGRLGVNKETGLLATIRLRPGEESSSLWQMRCLETTLKTELRSILDDS